jgi:hypothetical protein
MLMRVRAAGRVKCVSGYGSETLEGTVGSVVGHNERQGCMGNKFVRLESNCPGILAVLWDGETEGKVYDKFDNIVTCIH